MLELKVRGDKSVSVNGVISMLELKVRGDKYAGIKGKGR